MSVRGYLDRIGLGGTPPPTVATLRDVHRRHLAEIPYDNLGIMVGRPPDVRPDESLARIAAGGRAGYCFHHNGALEVVLRELGFDVVRRHGHVWTSDEHREGTDLNHLVLEVRGLPTDDNPGGRWWPDVGLGEGSADPLPLVEGEYGAGDLAVEITDLHADGWTYRHHTLGSFSGILVRPLPVDGAAIADAHATLSTPPDGAFTKMVVVQRIDEDHPDQVVTLRGCVLTRVGPGVRESTDVTAYDDWRAALDTVRLPVGDLDDTDLHALHARMAEMHEQWDRAGRP